MLWPVTLAAKKRVAAPMPEPATRRLQGDISRKANAAAIQFRPQANASSTTSNLAVVAASIFECGSDIVFGNPAGRWASAHAIAVPTGWRGNPVMQIRGRPL